MRIIRFRLLTLVVVGVIMSALSLSALWRVLSLTTEGRIERARDGLHRELERLAHVPQAEAHAALATAPDNALIGMRGGYWDGHSALPQMGGEAGQDNPVVPIVERPAATELGLAGLPLDWQRALTPLLIEARARGVPVSREQQQGMASLLVAARPAAFDAVVWTAIAVPPSHYHRFWLTVVILLALATAFLFSSAVWASVSFLRSASALHRCLVALGQDLSTPVPRLRIRELSEVAEGIAELAQSLRHAREAQGRMAQELAQGERLVALGRVVAGVAHEVRNPLASIKLRLDLAATSAALPALVAGAIQHSSEEIARLDRLVADLLLVAGRHLGPRQDCDVARLVRTRVETLSPWAALRGIHFVISGPAMCTAAIDPESVARAIDNLLRNAVDASPDGRAVTVTLVANETQVEIDVEDQGPGVPRPSELFEPFFTTKPDGTGLGLPISRAIARAHGGDVLYRRVSLGSSPGDAKPPCTRFVLSLPQGPAASAAVPPAPAQKEAA